MKYPTQTVISASVERRCKLIPDPNVVSLSCSMPISIVWWRNSSLAAELYPRYHNVMTTDTISIGDADIAKVGTLMGEPARATILMALLDGRAYSASTLALEAGVAPSTLSAHLARLVHANMVDVEVSGRNRYFRITRPEVANALEAIACIAPARPIRSLRQHTHAQAIRQARTCYDHLAGRLGVALLDALLVNGFIDVQDDPRGEPDPLIGAGRSNHYRLTQAGNERLGDLGVNVRINGRRPLTRYCLDWSEQQPHLAGALGASLLTRFVELGWLVPGERRVIKITPSGQCGLEHELGVIPDAWA